MMWVVVVVLLIVCMLLVFRLKQQQERVSALYRSDKLKSHFVKSIAYEIRNPLQSVMKLAEMIGNKDLYLSKEEKKHVADQISYHSSLMATLLDEVEIYADSNKKGHLITDERFSPNRVCERCIDANLHNVSEGVKMFFRQETGHGVFVSADRHLVELVLNKLVVLACRFTKKGDITVGCRYEEDSHRLTFVVQDTGGGIPEGVRMPCLTGIMIPMTCSTRRRLTSASPRSSPRSWVASFTGMRPIRMEHAWSSFFL